MKIYISLPISGRPIEEARQHADRVKAALSRKGHKPVSPFDIYTGSNNPSYADYITFDLRAMLDCDGIIFCQGWEQSLGCNIEHDAAMRFKSFVGRSPHARDFAIMYE